MSSRNCPNWVYFLIWSSLGLVFAVAMFISSYRDIKGIILSKSAYSHTVGIVKVSRTTLTYSRGSADYGYQIVYEYDAQGHKYWSDLIDFNFIKAGSQENFAKAKIEKYPIGAHVTVYYQRNHPQFAVLNPEAPHSTKVYVACMLILFFLSIFGIVMSYRSRPKALIP